MKNYRELLVWQKSMELVEEVYRLIQFLPKEETFALSNQMRRAAISIPSNIAEGNARESEKDFHRFLLIAQGSNAELETQLVICQRLGYLSPGQTAKAMLKCDEVGKMLRALMETLKAVAAKHRKY